MTIYSLCYLGNTVDQFDTAEEAYRARSGLVDKVMRDELPDYLTADHFDNREDALRQHTIVISDPDQGFEFPMGQPRRADVALAVLTNPETAATLRLLHDAASEAGLRLTAATIAAAILNVERAADAVYAGEV